MAITQRTPVVLIAAQEDHSLAGMLETHDYAVMKVRTAGQAVEVGRNVAVDAIVLDATLPDMTGVDASSLLNSDPRIRGRVPILILSPGKPTPAQRVAALRAGAWDFLCHPKHPEDLVVKLQTYVQAKRNIDAALSEGVVDPLTGLHTRPGLARRARELGALMARKHGALACIVFALEPTHANPDVGRIVARTSRVSDVVGMLSPREVAVLAPATGHDGALKLAQRVGHIVRDSLDGDGDSRPDPSLMVGYDAADNLMYSPIDPTELIARAAAAAERGVAEPTCPWVRRFDVTAVSESRPESIAVDVPRAKVPNARRKGL